MDIFYSYSQICVNYELKSENIYWIGAIEYSNFGPVILNWRV